MLDYFPETTHLYPTDTSRDAVSPASNVTTRRIVDE